MLSSTKSQAGSCQSNFRYKDSDQPSTQVSGHLWIREQGLQCNLQAGGAHWWSVCSAITETYFYCPDIGEFISLLCSGIWSAIILTFYLVQPRMHLPSDLVVISMYLKCLWSTFCMSSSLVYGNLSSHIYFAYSMQSHPVEIWWGFLMEGAVTV